MTNSIKIFAKLSNGNLAQVEIFGDLNKIFSYIENYKGNDVGNDIILEDFVTDTKSTGVIMSAK